METVCSGILIGIIYHMISMKLYTAQYEETGKCTFSVFGYFLSHGACYRDTRHTNMIPKDY